MIPFFICTIKKDVPFGLYQYDARTDYMKILKNVDIKNILQEDFNKVVSLKTIYKYTDFDSALRKILIDNTLKFSQPTEYNDPFDCHESLINLKSTDKIVHEALMSSEIGFILTRKDRRIIKREISLGTNTASILLKEREKYKISCFAENNDSVLMWGHYADKHQGICIGFEFPPIYEKFMLCPVKYIDKIIPIDGSSESIRTILYWLTTKSLTWKYEEEIRAILKTENKSSFELITINPQTVKEVIFGCKVSKSLIEKTIKTIKRCHKEYSKIKFKRMIINPENFSLKEVTIKPGRNAITNVGLHVR